MRAPFKIGSLLKANREERDIRELSGHVFEIMETISGGPSTRSVNSYVSRIFIVKTSLVSLYPTPHFHDVPPLSNLNVLVINVTFIESELACGPEIVYDMTGWNLTEAYESTLIIFTLDVLCHSLFCSIGTCRDSF